MEGGAARRGRLECNYFVLALSAPVHQEQFNRPTYRFVTRSRQALQVIENESVPSRPESTLCLSKTPICPEKGGVSPFEIHGVPGFFRSSSPERDYKKKSGYS